MFRLLAVDSLEWSIGGQGAMPVIPYHCSQAGKDERKQRQDFDFSKGDLYSGFFFQRQSTHFLIPLILYLFPCFFNDKTINLMIIFTDAIEHTSD